MAVLLLAGSARAGEDAPSANVANEAKNIARMNCGAQLEWILPDGSSSTRRLSSRSNVGAGPAVLIMDDDTINCALKEGDSTFIVALPQTAKLDRFTFVNENASVEGELRIAVANTNLPVASEKWTAVEGNIPFSHKRLFNLSLLGVEAKYVKLTFHVEKGGQIAAFGLYGNEQIIGFAHNDPLLRQISNSLPSGRLADTVNYNFANQYAQAKVVYVSSGRTELAPRLIDDDAQTSFAFAASDPQPTTIIELSAAQWLHRVSALFQPRAGKLEVFLLNELRANPADLSNLTPTATMNDEETTGKATLNFDPRGARYVAFRWTPTKPGSFEVAELHAFGHMPLALLAQQNEAPDLHASNKFDEVFGQYQFASNLEFFPIPQIPVVSP